MFGIRTRFQFLTSHFVKPALTTWRRYRELPSSIDATERAHQAINHQTIKAMRAAVGRQTSPFYAYHVYRENIEVAHRLGLAPRAVLEMGTGANLGPLFCFLAGGAQRAVGIDIAPIERDLAFYRELTDLLACVGGFRWWRPFAAEERRPGVRYPECWDDVNPEEILQRIEYLAPVASHQMPFDREFDLIYSCAAMEHFDRPEESVREIHKALRPGGLTIHGIDLRNHVEFDLPLGHLRWSPEEYQRRTQKYDKERGIANILQNDWREEVYCNRLLAADWQRIFKDAGMEVLACDVISELDPKMIEVDKLARPYRNRSVEELSPLIIRLVAKRRD